LLEEWLWSFIRWFMENFVAFFSGALVAVVVILAILLFYPEKLEHLIAMISRLFAWCSYRLERRYIGKSIKADLNTHIKELNREAPVLSLAPVDIKWVEAEDVYAELRKGKIIIFMRNYRKQPKNLAVAASVYVAKALLPKVRRYVNPSLMEAIDYVVAKKLVSHSPEAVGYLVEIYAERLKKNADLKELIPIVDDIQGAGYLTRIILREFKNSFIGQYPREPSQEMWDETIEFVLRTHELLTKPPEERGYHTVQPGRWIKAAIVPIARSETVLTRGLEPHFTFIKECLNKGVSDFFVVAAGGVNIRLAKFFVKELQRLGFEEEASDEYRGHYRDIPRMRLFCAFLRVPQPDVVLPALAVLIQEMRKRRMKLLETG